MNLGFIGTGSMGSILIDAFLQSAVVEPAQITAVNRTKSKAQQLAHKYPGLAVADNIEEVAVSSDIIFICVKPLEYQRVLLELQKAITAQHIVISITSPISLKLLEESLPCKIVKIIPSITNYERSGASLCIYGNRIAMADQELIEALLRKISTPLQIEEKYVRVTSDLSSCGPAFLAYFIEQFVKAAVEETGIPKEEAIHLASEMVLGTGKLLTSGGFTPDSLQARVSVPGGITAEGLRILATELGGVFNTLIRTTHAKYDDDIKKIEAAFHTIQVD